MVWYGEDSRWLFEVGRCKELEGEFRVTVQVVQGTVEVPCETRVLEMVEGTEELRA